MRLTELRPQWCGQPDVDGKSWPIVQLKRDARGVMFLCPKCFITNKGPYGTHSIICWDPTIPQTMEPKPGRWNLVGIDFEDLTLTAGSSSVYLTDPDGCKAHFFIRHGEIVTAG